MFIGFGFLVAFGAGVLSSLVTYVLTPTQKIETGRLDDLTSAKSNYGESLPWIWGTVKVGGNLLWATKLIERKKTKKKGQILGMGGTKITTYFYYGNFAVILAECPFRPLSEVRKIWANKKLVYSTVGGAETINKAGNFAGQYLTIYNGQFNQSFDPFIQQAQAASTFNYSYVTGEGIEGNPLTLIAAFLGHIGLNQTQETPGYTYRSYLVFNRLPLEDFGNQLPTIETELVGLGDSTLGQIIRDIGGLLYPTEELDTTLVDAVPVSGFFINSIAAAKNAISDLQKAYFFDIIRTGNKKKFVPYNHPRNLVQIAYADLNARQQGLTNNGKNFEITERDPSTLPSEVIVHFLDKDQNYDRNRVYARLETRKENNINAVTVELPLVLTASEAQTICDRLLFLEWLRAKKVTFSLPPAYLYLEPGDLIPDIFEQTDGKWKITQVRVGANLQLDFEAEPYDDSIFGISRAIQQAYLNGVIANYSVSVQTSATTASDVMGVSNFDGSTVYTQGTDYTVNSDGSINILSGGAIADGENIVVSTTGEIQQPDEDNALILPSDTFLLVLDIPLIDDTHQDYSIYLTGGGDNNWTEAEVYYSVDGISYESVATLEAAGLYGTVTAVTAVTPELEVTVENWELESISTAQLNAGYNLALVGDKIIQFQTATETTTNTYTLTDITQGKRGTAEGSFVIGERFVLLNGTDAYLTSFTITSSDLGQTRYFKAITEGQELADVDPVTLTIEGNAQKPYAPINLAATKDEVGNITITWDRRDRHAGEETDPTKIPLSETREEYEMAIITVNPTTEIRVKTSYKNSLLYTLEEQITDFGAHQQNITVQVYQMSTAVGRGYPAQATLTPTFAAATPTITSFNPVQGQEGDTITLTGSGLAGITDVTVNGLSQDAIAVASDTEASFVIATSTASGIITAVAPGGNGSSAIALIIMNSLSPSLIRDSLASLTGENRLDSSAIKNLSVSSGFTDESIIAYENALDLNLPDFSYSGNLIFSNNGLKSNGGTVQYASPNFQITQRPVGFYLEHFSGIFLNSSFLRLFNVTQNKIIFTLVFQSDKNIVIYQGNNTVLQAVNSNYYDINQLWKTEVFLNPYIGAIKVNTILLNSNYSFANTNYGNLSSFFSIGDDLKWNVSLANGAILYKQIAFYGAKTP